MNKVIHAFLKEVHVLKHEGVYVLMQDLHVLVHEGVYDVLKIIKDVFAWGLEGDIHNNIHYRLK